MTMPHWALLAFTLWTLAVLALGVGVYRWTLILGGRAQLNSFPADEAHGTPLYRRIIRAHANCIENLPVFAALVFLVDAAGANAPLIDLMSATVVAARIPQSLIHIASGGNVATGVRFAFFAVQLVVFFAMAATLALGARG